jgi:hypothetical protein
MSVETLMAVESLKQRVKKEAISGRDLPGQSNPNDSLIAKKIPK